MPDGGPGDIFIADGRWRGDYGIGRFAREVLRRIGLPRLITDGPNPASALDPFFLWSAQRRAGVHAFYSPGFCGSPSRRVLQVLTVHDLIHLRVSGRAGIARRAYYQRIVKPAIVRARIVLTVSEASREEIINWSGLRPEQVLVVGDGCSEAFTPEGPNWGTGRPFVLYVGNTKAHKNLGLLLSAFDSMPSEFGLICVLPATDGLPREIGRSRRSQSITIMSRLSDAQLAQVYRGAAVTAVPSLYEGFGLPALESIACGTPVVSLEDCPSVSEIVADAGVRIPFEAGPTAFAAALTDVASSELDWSEQCARQAAPHGWGNVAERVKNALNDVAYTHGW